MAEIQSSATCPKCLDQFMTTVDSEDAGFKDEPQPLCPKCTAAQKEI